MYRTIIEKIALTCEEALAYHGKGNKRDQATIDFWNGALAALIAAEHEDATLIGRVGQIHIAYRGYSGIETILRKMREREKDGGR